MKTTLATLKAQAIASQNDSNAVIFARRCHTFQIPEPVREYRFVEGRKFALDFAWPDYKIGVEQDGGVWTKGGHSTGKGILRDMEKHNLAVCAGWAVLRVTPQQLATEETLVMLAKLISDRTYDMLKSWGVQP